jgi:hypothetical protein
MTIDPLDPFDPEELAYPAGVPEVARGLAAHARILELARELPTIANKGDHARLSRQASALLEAFVRHAEEERAAVLRLPTLTARLVQKGQQRVVDRLVSLVLEADLAEVPCRCSVLADEVASLIEVQIVSEEWDQSDR